MPTVPLSHVKTEAFAGAAGDRKWHIRRPGPPQQPFYCGLIRAAEGESTVLGNVYRDVCPSCLDRVEVVQ